MKRTISIKKVKSTKCPRINFKPKLDQARIANTLSLLNPERYNEVKQRIHEARPGFTSEDVPYLIRAINEYGCGTSAVMALQGLKDPRAFEPIADFFEYAYSGDDISAGHSALVKLGGKRALAPILRKIEELEIFEFFEKKPSETEVVLEGHINDNEIGLLISAAEFGDKRSMELLCDLKEYYLFRSKQGSIALAIASGLKITKSEKAFHFLMDFDPKSIKYGNSFGEVDRILLDFVEALSTLEDEKAIKKILLICPYSLREFEWRVIDPLLKQGFEVFFDYLNAFIRLSNSFDTELRKSVAKDFLMAWGSKLIRSEFGANSGGFVVVLSRLLRSKNPEHVKDFLSSLFELKSLHSGKDSIFKILNNTFKTFERDRITYQDVNEILLLIKNLFRKYAKLISELSDEELESVLFNLETYSSYSGQLKLDLSTGIDHYLLFLQDCPIIFSISLDKRKIISAAFYDLWTRSNYEGGLFLTLILNILEMDNLKELDNLTPKVLSSNDGGISFELLLTKIVDLYLSCVDSSEVGTISQIQEKIPELVELNPDYLYYFSEDVFGKLTPDQFGTLMVKVDNDSLIQKIGERLFEKSEAA